MTKIVFFLNECYYLFSVIKKKPIDFNLNRFPFADMILELQIKSLCYCLTNHFTFHNI